MSGRTPIVRELLLVRPSFTLLPWPCSGLVLLNGMLLAESTVDAEAAQSVDCSKVLVNGSCNLGVDLAVMVVEAANCLVGGHEGLMACASWFLKASTFSTAAARSASRVRVVERFPVCRSCYSFPSGVLPKISPRADTILAHDTAVANITKSQVDGSTGFDLRGD